MEYVGYILIGLIVILGLWITLSSRKKRWYKVYRAREDEYGMNLVLLYRDIRERWWRTSDRYMRFKDEQGREVTFPDSAHWALWWIEVLPEELDVVRDEIRRMKEKLAEKEVG